MRIGYTPHSTAAMSKANRRGAAIYLVSAGLSARLACVHRVCDEVSRYDIPDWAIPPRCSVRRGVHLSGIGAR